MFHFHVAMKSGTFTPIPEFLILCIIYLHSFTYSLNYYFASAYCNLCLNAIPSRFATSGLRFKYIYIALASIYSELFLNISPSGSLNNILFQILRADELTSFILDLAFTDYGKIMVKMVSIA